MSKIKVGDIVELKDGGNYLRKLHNKVTSISGCGDYLRVNGRTSGTHVANFKVVVDTSKHHVHRDLIIAWAKGAEIEIKGVNGKWNIATFDGWSENVVYRIKPDEPTELEKLIKEHKAMGETIRRLTEEQNNG